MGVIFRLLVGILGALSVATTYPHWFKLNEIVASRGISGIGVMGNANVRADVGGLFLGMGILMLVAAATRSRQWALAALLVICSSFAGRMVSYAIDGGGEGVYPPMAVEVGAILILSGALIFWKRRAA